MNDLIAARTERTRWFADARFGLFLHWGLYAIPARGEWVRSVERIDVDTYQQFFDEFNPVDFDPKAWARAAKEAGMRYAVLTAKHHDGFCLFDSAYTDYKSTNTPCGRDLVREFLDAFRAEGLKVGLYYSLLDWHHPDYPHQNDANHPMRGREDYPDEGRDFDRYLDYMHAQVRELLTGYGKLDIMWFDFSYGEMQGEKWRASQLMETVRSLQPWLITDNRLEGSGSQSGSILTGNPSPYAGDFACPEQMIPPRPVVNTLGEPVPWESCLTMNDNWGYAAHDTRYKSTSMLIRALVECVSKGGNMILNIGPDAKGRFPAQALERLREIGAWMHDNGESIYGCGVSSLPKPAWGRFTQKGRKLYAHILEESLSAYCLEGLAGKVEKLRLPKDGSEMKLTRFWNVSEYPDDAFFFLNGTRSFPLPDSRDTVVEITLKE